MINFQVICEFSGERNYVKLCDNMTLYVSWFKVVLKRKDNLPLPGKMSNHLKLCRISSIILTDLQTSYPVAISSLYPLISIYTSERDKGYWNDLISHKTLQNLPLMFICLFGNSWNHLPKTVGICLFNGKLCGPVKAFRNVWLVPNLLWQNPFPSSLNELCLRWISGNVLSMFVKQYPVLLKWILPENLSVLGSKLPLFPYNRGWKTSH